MAKAKSTSKKAIVKTTPKVGKTTPKVKTVKSVEQKTTAQEYFPRLKVQYRENVIAHLKEQFSYKNVYQVPRLKKIVINVGMGKAVQEAKQLDVAVKELTLISGQKPVVTKAKKSIAGFKIRAGMSIGCSVTMRGDRMYEFLDRLCSAALPRIRDFRGISEKSFDGKGNYTLGIKEQLIFPEISFEDTMAPHGMDITLVTTAESDREGRALLERLGLPFRSN